MQIQSLSFLDVGAQYTLHESSDTVAYGSRSRLIPQMIDDPTCMLPEFLQERKETTTTISSAHPRLIDEEKEKAQQVKRNATSGVFNRPKSPKTYAECGHH
jgi:hypothetical protein